MAIDTANKRGSLIGRLPIADGSIVKADRLQHMGLYAGADVSDIFWLTGGAHGVLSATSIIILGDEEMLIGGIHASLSTSLEPHAIIGLFGQIAPSVSGTMELRILFFISGQIESALSGRASLGIDGYNGLITGY